MEATSVPSIKSFKYFFWPRRRHQGHLSILRSLLENGQAYTFESTYGIPSTSHHSTVWQGGYWRCGPLAYMTKSKNRYILMYIDLGSRYPDAVPLSTTTADVIAKALLNILSRLSVPLEILSDRGNNFLSSVMMETFKFLGILHSKMAAYRPQSNRAVERFHHTLMQMVRKSVADHSDWDEHLQYLLFACREAPCSSTGFSPFELLFGHEVHGPLDILRQQWVSAKKTSTTVTEWLLKLRTDLTEMRALAIKHQEKTQARTKA